jgi:hypothetical protein
MYGMKLCIKDKYVSSLFHFILFDVIVLGTTNAIKLFIENDFRSLDYI